MYYSNKPFMMLMYSTLIISSMMALSSTNWIFLWMAMEINMLSFIPLMTATKSNQETEASIKYFMAQALGSSLMLMTSMTQWTTSSFTSMNIILMSAIMLKLGMAPFHFWFPTVMTALPWASCMILATWQKLAPLIVLSFFLYNTVTSFILFISVLNSLLGGIMGMNQSHLRTIMAYSSITHMGWMSSMLYCLKPLLTITYFIMYCLITFPLFVLFCLNMQTNNKQLNKLNSMSPIMQIMLPLMLLSLGGMPPMTGFIPKWLTIMTLSQEAPMALILMIIGAMMNMYFYMNILFNSLLSMNLTNLLSSNNYTIITPLFIVSLMSLFLLPLIMM